MDKIVCAAIRFEMLFGDRPEYYIIAGVRHYDKIMHEQIKAVDTFYWSRKANEEQGFLDNHGKFLNREEALEVAYAAKQVRANKCTPVHKLFSEDLY